MTNDWKLENRDGIGILELDLPDTPVNILTRENLEELKEKLIDISNQKDFKALLFTSAKDKFFIAGANINEINAISTDKEAFEAAEQGKEVFQLIEDLKIPTIAVINGVCLGGGYELSLACRYRVASFSSDVKMGLPEVKLGILPGFGGSIRLPKLIGLTKSLPLILQGKVLSGDKALRQGLVDKLFYENTLKDDAISFANEVIENPLKKKSKKKFLNWFLEDTVAGKALVFKKTRESVLEKTKGVYPAPLEIIDLIESTYGKELRNSFRKESEAFARLATTSVSKSLIRLFFTNEKYKKKKWTDSQAQRLEVKKAAVVGAGIMGGGIAHLISDKNIPVRVKDIASEPLGYALKEARKIYDGSVKRRRIKPFDRDRKMQLISTGTTYEGFWQADIVVEAVIENMDIKKAVFNELSEKVREDIILASNTSSLSVSEMSSGIKNPERAVGLHFFNPVNRMPLVEVIRGEKTSDETLEKTISFARSLGKTVIVTADRPGFLVNRLLMPYLNEAAYLLDEGFGASHIDSIATDFGMPMGPIELTDQVGIDVAYKVAHILYEGFGDRMKLSPVLDIVKEKKLLGKKSGKGFYIYSGKKKSVNPEVTKSAGSRPKNDEDALKRMIYIMINEAARCLEEGVIDEPETVDVGMVFGTGFPPFRAGLMRYADSIGLYNILTDLKRFAAEIDAKRFEPAPLLVKLASEGKTFYGK